MSYYKAERCERDVIPSFSGGGYRTITEVLQRHHNGEIDLTEYWSVGDERVIHLDAIPASKDDLYSVEESQEEQDVTLVILHGPDCFDLVDGGKNAFVIGVKDSLATTGRINPETSSEGGWGSTPRRPWCDYGFFPALPKEVQKWFKKFKFKSSDGEKATTSSELENYFTLPSRSEIFGGSNKTYTPDSEDTTQFDYYKTAANRIKTQGIGGTTRTYFLRSPSLYHFHRFCMVNTDGTLIDAYPYGTRGLSPFGCV